MAMGGAEKQCLMLASALKPEHNVHVVVVNPQPIHPPYHDYLEKERIEHIFLSANPIKKFFELRSYLRKNKIEVIFSFLPRDTTLAAVCGKLTGVSHIFGGIRNSYLPKMKFFVLRWVHNNLLNYTIANNYAAYRAAIDYGFKDRIFVIPNGIEIRPLQQRQEEEKKVIQIISVGRFVKQKAYETALKSLAQLKGMLASKQVFKYTIVGSGPEREAIVQNISRFGLENEVELISDPPSVYEILDASDIYLCTSTFEGISNAIMEAMNCALPIVATDAGDNSRLVIHEKNGFIAGVGDHDSISGYLYDLCESLPLRTQMGMESYKLLKQKFSYEEFKSNYLTLLANLDSIQLENGKFSVRGK